MRTVANYLIVGVMAVSVFYFSAQLAFA